MDDRRIYIVSALVLAMSFAVMGAMVYGVGLPPSSWHKHRDDAATNHANNITQKARARLTLAATRRHVSATKLRAS
jgi:hypothetical protein